METPNITIVLTDPYEFKINCTVNAPSLQIAIHMMEQALEEIKHAFIVDRQKKQAVQIFDELRTAQLIQNLPKGGHS